MNSSIYLNRSKLLIKDVLSFVTDENRAGELVENLIDKYGTLDAIFSSSIVELKTVANLSANEAFLLKISASIASRRITDRFEFTKKHSYEEIEEYLVGLFKDLSCETVYMLLLDNKGRVLSSEFMGEGTVNSSNVYPRKMVERAMIMNAKSVIIAHNHPRGKSSPSKEDMITTTKLSTVFASAGINLDRHYIVGENEISVVNLG